MGLHDVTPVQLGTLKHRLSKGLRLLYAVSRKSSFVEVRHAAARLNKDRTTKARIEGGSWLG